MDLFLHILDFLAISLTGVILFLCEGCLKI